MGEPLLSIVVNLLDPKYEKVDRLFDFVEYTRCQVHMPILSEFFGRDPFILLRAFEHATGKSTKVQQCKQTLKFFYIDMLNMLVKLLKEVPELENKIQVCAILENDNDFSICKVVAEDVRRQLELLLEDPDYETTYSLILTQFSPQEMLKLKPTHNLAMAAIVAWMLEKKDMELLEVL
jgi:hypothetical protein